MESMGVAGGRRRVNIDSKHGHHSTKWPHLSMLSLSSICYFYFSFDYVKQQDNF